MLERKRGFYKQAVDELNQRLKLRRELEASGLGFA